MASERSDISNGLPFQQLLLLQLVNLQGVYALGRSGLYLKLQVVKVVLGGVVICAAAAVSKDIYVVSFFTAATAVLSVLLVDMQPAMRFVGIRALVN